MRERIIECQPCVECGYPVHERSKPNEHAANCSHAIQSGREWARVQKAIRKYSRRGRQSR